MKAINSQVTEGATVSDDAGVFAATTRLNYAVELLVDLLVPVNPLASDESGAIEEELTDPIYSEWEDACNGHEVSPMSHTAGFMHEIAGEIEMLSARIRLSKELRPIICAELPPIPNY